MNKKFKINLSNEFMSALKRRHHGANHTKKEIEKTYKHLTYLYKGYCRNRKKEDWLLNVFWDEEKIEEQYGSRIFNNAHLRLRRCRDNMLKFHKYMFSVLTSFDGNSGQEYHQYSVISSDDIMYDFENKYIKKGIK